jgi:structural maintenance of chromosome 3 (chondroitin sulfate proteoglycan 6)
VCSSFCQTLKEELANHQSALSVTSLTAHGLDTEMEDLLRSRTEIECIIADLEQAGEKGDARRQALQSELDEILRRINDIETELMEVVPEWEDRVKREKDERTRLALSPSRFEVTINVVLITPFKLGSRASTT